MCENESCLSIMKSKHLNLNITDKLISGLINIKLSIPKQTRTSEKSNSID